MRIINSFPRLLNDPFRTLISSAKQRLSLAHLDNGEASNRLGIFTKSWHLTFSLMESEKVAYSLSMSITSPRETRNNIGRSAADHLRVYGCERYPRILVYRIATFSGAAATTTATYHPISSSKHCQIRFATKVEMQTHYTLQNNAKKYKTCQNKTRRLRYTLNPFNNLICI